MKFIQISVFDPNPVTLWMSEDSFNDTKCCVSKEAFSLKQSSIQQLQNKKRISETSVMALQKSFILSLGMQAKSGLNAKCHWLFNH